MFKSLAIVGVCLALTGCAALPVALPFGATALTSGTGLEVHSDAEVKLTEANFVLVRTNACGTSKGFQLFGFLTIVSPKYSVAMGRLYAQAGVREGRPQTIVHLTLQRSSDYFLLFSIPELIVNADVVEFVPRPSPPRSSPPRP
jgi:hypothetical protein